MVNGETGLENAPSETLTLPVYVESMNTATKYPHISIRLVGEDGNAFSILARCTEAMKRNGLRDEVEAFFSEATSDDYGHLLRTVMAWFSVDEDDEDENPYACPNGCGEKYAVGGCPACGDEDY